MGGGDGGACLLVSFVPMLEQCIAEHTLDSVFEILKTNTLFTVFSLQDLSADSIARLGLG